jgi:acetylornithine deacetylase/succinyl-diaminopimelate desuccinylase-like protein
MNVVPFLNPGFIDGKWFSKLGIIWYGFTPLIGVSPEGWSTFETIHAVNERVPVELVKKGSRVLLKLIESWMF